MHQRDRIGPADVARACMTADGRSAATFSDGVVVVPQAQVDEVLAMSLDIEQKEAEQARFIRESGSLAAGLAKYNRI